MSTTQNIKLGLLKETVTLALSQADYVIEKVDFDDFHRPTVEFIVSEGTNAVIKGVHYPSGRRVEFSKNELKTAKTVYLYSSSWNTSVDVQRFFGGNFDLSLSIAPTVRGSFAIVGSASIAIDHYPSVVRYFGRTMTKAQLSEAITQEFRRHVKDDISAIASQNINASTTEKDLAACLSSIESEVKRSGNKSVIADMGVGITKISLGINTLPETDETINRLKEELAQRGLREINADETKRLAEEEDKKRQ